MGKRGVRGPALYCAPGVRRSKKGEMLDESTIIKALSTVKDVGGAGDIVSNDRVQDIMEGARSGVMVNLLSQALSGATAPVTMAGTLVGHNAEVLSGIVLNQLTCKGSPVMYGSSTCPMDLKRSTATVGSPECGMISAAVAQIAQRYSIPSWTAGG